jgi:hypothetical protein
MEREADVLELHGDRVPTRPYDLDVLRAQLEEEQRASAAAHNPGQIWFVGVQGHSVGPLTVAGLEGLHARGQLHRGSMVWREGWPVWAAAEAIPELRAVLGLPAAHVEPPSLPEAR